MRPLGEIETKDAPEEFLENAQLATREDLTYNVIVESQVPELRERRLRALGGQRQAAVLGSNNWYFAKLVGGALHKGR